MNVQAVLPYLQAFLTICNICVMVYVFFKFINKPQDNIRKEVQDLKSEIAELKVEIKDTKNSLLQGNDRFREYDRKFKKQGKTNTIFKKIVLAFVNFEIAYCQHTNYEFTDEIVKAKNELEHLLTDDNESEDDE